MTDEPAPDPAHPLVQVLAPLSTKPAGTPPGPADTLRASFAGLTLASILTAAWMALKALATALRPILEPMAGVVISALPGRLAEWAEHTPPGLKHFGLVVLGAGAMGLVRMWARSHPPGPDPA